MNRTNIATIARWTLQRRQFRTNGHDYIIQADDHRLLVSLYVNERTTYLRDENNEFIRDEDGQRIRKAVYEVIFTPTSRLMDLDEAAEFATLVQEAVVAARSFHHMIEAAELDKGSES